MLSMTGREQERAGVLTLAAVPIGRAEDASPRLAAELTRATVIAAEDTRRVRWLAASLNITLRARIVSYYDAVEARRTPGLLSDLQAGGPAGLDGVVVGDDTGLELDVQARRQPAHAAGVLGRDQGGPGEFGRQPG